MGDTFMRERFTEIYATDEWKGGSGPGSFPENTKGYRRFLEAFLRKHQIRSVVDLGCGDWQFSRLVDWGAASYHGFDIVPGVIDANQQRYARPGVSFSLFDGDLKDLPRADLLICKDVLQHWSNAAIARFLEQIDGFSLALITNCINPKGPTIPSDIDDGGFRYLDIRQAPFGVEAQMVYTFANPDWKPWMFFIKPGWRKNVLLLQSGAGPAR